MLKMRLQRIGRKNDASFRVIVTDSRRGPKSGKHIDLLGSYNPKLNQFQIDGDKAKDWISKGVQVSDTLHNLLITNKIVEGKKKNVLPKKAPIINEEALKAEEEAKAAAAAPVAETTAPAEGVAEEAPTEEGAPATEEAPASGEVETPATAEEAPAEAVSETTEEAPASVAETEAGANTEEPKEA
ncbi:30S ribosomal protein S16 [Candidatus Kaiserbacteria bacterium]|nr:30S ribosomal protein S16 [Candidatus Kaiserbacteria bacterium]